MIAEFSDYALMALRAATLRLAWHPDQFWDSTIKDFVFSISPYIDDKRTSPLSFDEFSILRQRFPDE